MNFIKESFKIKKEILLSYTLSFWSENWKIKLEEKKTEKINNLLFFLICFKIPFFAIFIVFFFRGRKKCLRQEE